MVHPEGFEPPILGTGNLRFIQLSYGCKIDLSLARRSKEMSWIKLVAITDSGFALAS